MHTTPLGLGVPLPPQAHTSFIKSRPQRPWSVLSKWIMCISRPAQDKGPPCHPAPPPRQHTLSVHTPSHENGQGWLPGPWVVRALDAPAGASKSLGLGRKAGLKLGVGVLPQCPGASIVLGCIPDIYKACTWPALRPKREPGVSDRNMDGLPERGADKSEARFCSDSPLCVADIWQVLAVVFAPGGRGDCQL